MEQPIRTYSRTDRPWGSFLQFTHGETTTVKIIIVNAREAFSLQHHQKRDEWWYVISGNGMIQIGEAHLPVKADESHFIPKGTPHRITAMDEPVKILEISFGEFDENDITRLEDRYGRV